MARHSKYPAALIAVVCRAAEQGVSHARIARQCGITPREVYGIVHGTIRGALASPAGAGDLSTEDPQRMQLEIGLDLQPPEQQRYDRMVARRRKAEKALNGKARNG